ncbi:isopenicillin N synthase family dioxygenase [Celerinatantimonas sp. YJH-8]|uniref:isopenicillin N synthase family dioxygenase n=1 Tax=Celerinatantimonas sp. YJH-8 TaxID=3228714 RepID=UPI0038BF3703
MNTSSYRNFQNIPVVDISLLYSDDLSHRLKVAEQIKTAASQVGFLYITGHQVPASTIDNLKQAAETFFMQPHELKMRSYIGYSSNHSGYVPEGEERFYSTTPQTTPPDHKESYDISFELNDMRFARPMLGKNQWPELVGFREAVSDYYQQAFQLGQLLFRGFALALGLPESTFVEQAQMPPSQLRMVHYPYSQARQAQEGIGAHTDYECFTLLLPTADGLEVLNGQGQWIDAPFRPDCFVVNIGDMLEVLSNGRFIATSHRVRKVQQERYSFPLFCSLDYDTCVEPILPPLPGNKADQYGPIICGDHLYSQTIHTFQYLQKRLQDGDITLPQSAKPIATFGQFKNVQTNIHPAEDPS